MQINVWVYTLVWCEALDVHECVPVVVGCRALVVPWRCTWHFDRSDHDHSFLDGHDYKYDLVV
jgi:hypothetical protein